MLITSTVEICIQQLGRVEEMVWLPYDAGLSAAGETLVGILKRVIVTPSIYPHFFEFLHVDIQSTGRTMSRPWSQQPNDVMSEIVCAQLHSELLGRRHSTLQSHGLFALAKHLSLFVGRKEHSHWNGVWWNCWISAWYKSGRHLLESTYRSAQHSAMSCVCISSSVTLNMCSNLNIPKFRGRLNDWTSKSPWFDILPITAVGCCVMNICGSRFYLYLKFI